MGICRIIVSKLSTNHLHLSIGYSLDIDGMEDMALDMVDMEDMVLDMVDMVGMVYDVMAYNHVPIFRLCL